MALIRFCILVAKNMFNYTQQLSKTFSTCNAFIFHSVHFCLKCHKAFGEREPPPLLFLKIVIFVNKKVFYLILGTRLRAIFSSSKTTTSNITVWWNHPYQDADLVQSYNVSLRAFDSSYNFQTSVELQTNYTFESYFLPGYVYFFEITSVVFLNDSADTIFVKTDAINFIVGKNFITFSCGNM